MIAFPTQLDKIDQWLADNFGILPGAASSSEYLRYKTARQIAEVLWPNKEDLQECKIPIGERYDEVLRAAQTAVGKRLTKGRRQEDVLIRVFVSYRLRCEGYSCEEIGKAMNRDHSTVVHYARKNMGDMLSLPHMYKDELKMYNKMNEILDKHEDS